MYSLDTLNTLQSLNSVRPDAGVMLMFEVFNYLWRHSHIPARRKPCALTFQIVPGDREFGFMEFMADSAPVRGCDDFDAELKGLSDGGRDAFLRTLAGSLVAGHVMGIGDRHEDNMMLWYGGGASAPLLYFQLDFKHVFGNQTKGVDAPPLTVPARLKQSLEKFGMWSGSEASAKPGLAELCVDAFRVLRRCSGTLRALST